ncbi:hypothetical protein ACFSJY_16650 [Thalassotalea euphylliae]|uniref:hypothetical protein n=1 Tax=Thalassotalea euphylliae TaxID=1655234 RepID=UPI003631D946
MNFNASLYGPTLLLFMLFMGAFSYYLGRKKSENPLLTMVVGTALSMIPPVGLIFIAILANRDDIDVEESIRE